MIRALLLILILAAAACVGRPGKDATGEEIFSQLCSNCHGDDLGGGIGPPVGASSNAAGQPDEFLRMAIVDGRGSMPSFSSSLDDAQLDRLIEYLREEQSK